MSTAPAISAFPINEGPTTEPVGRSRCVTLLELVRAVTEEADDDAEVVATVLHMLRSGAVRLRGNFRNCPPEDFGL